VRLIEKFDSFHSLLGSKLATLNLVVGSVQPDQSNSNYLWTLNSGYLVVSDYSNSITVTGQRVSNSEIFGKGGQEYVLTKIGPYVYFIADSEIGMSWVKF
jgi:hypothetical protein